MDHFLNRAALVKHYFNSSRGFVKRVRHNKIESDFFYFCANKILQIFPYFQ